jgi:hypothetical protein
MKKIKYSGSHEIMTAKSKQRKEHSNDEKIHNVQQVYNLIPGQLVNAKEHSVEKGIDIFGKEWSNPHKNGDDMIYWFMKKKRGRKDVLLLGVPMMALVFVLLIMAGSTQSSEQVENYNDGIFEAYEEVFSAINPADPADVYIQWDMAKKPTNPAWLPMAVIRQLRRRQRLAMII